MLERKKVEKNIAPRVGPEPTTFGIPVRCDTNYATGEAVFPSTFLGIYMNVFVFYAWGW